MKAFHHTKHPYSHSQDSTATPSRRDSASKDSRAELLSRHEELAYGKARSDAKDSKPLQRKVIRRPPSVPRSKEGFMTSSSKHLQNGDSSCQWAEKADHIGVDAKTLSVLAHGSSAGDVYTLRTSKDRPSSAPQFSTRVPSPAMLGSVKSEGGAIRQRQGNNPSKKVPSSTGGGKVDQRRRRSALSTDFMKGSGDKAANTMASAHSLRSSVQRLHEEVSMRVNQDSYVVQGLMNRADALGGDIDTLPNSHHSEMVQDAESGQVRRRLSFDEDAAAAVEAKREVASGSRSRSCVPFGRRLGAGMVDTGSVPSASGSGRDMSVGGSLQNSRASAAFWTTAESKPCQTNVNSNFDNDENTFVRNIKTSRGLATSTPRRDDLHQSTVSASPILNENGHGVGLRNLDSYSSNNDILPERLVSRSSQQKRPASVGALPIQPRRGGDVWASGVAKLSFQQSVEGVISG